MTLKDIILAVKQSCNETSIKPSDDMVLDCSTRIYNSQSFKGKEVTETKEQIREVIKVEPSEKQIAYLIQLGYTGDVTKLDKTEANKLIKELKEKR